MADLRRVIIILMALAVVCTAIGVIHCYLSNYYMVRYARYYSTGYYIIFSILLCMSGFLLVEQVWITDGTIAPLNRLRTIFAFVAAVALFVFGVLAAVEANRLWSEYPTYHDHRNAVIAAVIAFVGMIIYILEAVARNRKSRIV